MVDDFSYDDLEQIILRIKDLFTSSNLTIIKQVIRILKVSVVHHPSLLNNRVLKGVNKIKIPIERKFEFFCDVINKCINTVSPCKNFYQTLFNFLDSKNFEIINDTFKFLMAFQEKRERGTGAEVNEGILAISLYLAHIPVLNSINI